MFHLQLTADKRLPLQEGQAGMFYLKQTSDHQYKRANIFVVQW